MLERGRCISNSIIGEIMTVQLLSWQLMTVCTIEWVINEQFKAVWYKRLNLIIHAEQLTTCIRIWHFQGEKCSISIQMWHYHLRGLHDDLWRVGSGGNSGGEVMVRILADVIADTTSFLEQRYCRVCLSYSRTKQFKWGLFCRLY